VTPPAPLLEAVGKAPNHPQGFILAPNGIGTVSKITLDAETFKALASSTRLTVLKALDERRKTLTELAHELQLNKATVHEHLQLLLAADLVRKRDDEGRKWIYYELTWTGQGILKPEATTTFNVLLALSTLAAGGGVFMLGRALDWWMDSAADNAAPRGGETGQEDTFRTTGGNETAQPEASSQANDTQQLAAPAEGFGMEDSGADGPPGFFDDGGWVALALVAVFVLFSVLAFFLHRKLAPKPLDEAHAAAAESAEGGSGPG
jgi:DNA-binding transcriptional ArsR family regulator